MQVSKDVRRLQQFEEALLSGYQQFLTLLDETVRGRKHRFWICNCDTVLDVEGVCLSTLMKSGI